jgi:hypothetical protein
MRPPHLNWILQSSGLLRGVRAFETDVSGLPIGPIFMSEAVQEVAVQERLLDPLIWDRQVVPKRLFSNHFTPHSNPENGKIRDISSQWSTLWYITKTKLEFFQCLIVY